MKRRKDKKTFAKLGLIFTILLILLASISMSYSAWTDTIMIHGTINTGNWEETAWARMYNDPDNFTYNFSESSWATYIIYNETQQSTFYIYASQYNKIGELYVSNDSSYLYVEYNLDDGYSMSESQLHIATSLDGIPQTPPGNPKIGNFEYNASHPYINEYTYMIPWNQSWNNQDLFIAAHAVV